MSLIPANINNRSWACLKRHQPYGCNYGQLIRPHADTATATEDYALHSRFLPFYNNYSFLIEN